MNPDDTLQEVNEFNSEDLLPAPLFFAVSTTKLLWMSVLTLGLYEIYWFYQNWHIIKKRENSNIKPALRSIFAFFFCFELFKRIRDTASQFGFESLKAGLLAAGWILLSVVSGILPDEYFVVGLLPILFLLPVQAKINQINAVHAPAYEANGEFTKINMVFMAVGGIFLFLIIMGILESLAGGNKLA